MAKTSHLPCIPEEDADSEDSTYCPFSTQRSNGSSVAGTFDREDEASSIKELFTITEDDCPPPSFASFYSEFLRDEAIKGNEGTKKPSSRTTRTNRSHAPVSQVAQLVFLEDLIKGFERLEFQIELQRVLVSVRNSSDRTESVMSKIAQDRIDLEVSVYQQCMRKHGFPQKRGPFSGTILVWELIAPFLDNAAVTRRLSKIDELLALPSNSTIDEVLAWEHGKQ